MLSDVRSADAPDGHPPLSAAFATAAVVQEVGYSNNLQIPIQVAVPAGDTVHFGSAQTMFGTRLGIDVLDNTNGIKFGISGSYDQSAEYQAFRGKAYIVVPITQLLTGRPVTARH